MVEMLVIPHSPHQRPHMLEVYIVISKMRRRCYFGGASRSGAFGIQVGSKRVLLDMMKGTSEDNL